MLFIDSLNKKKRRKVTFKKEESGITKNVSKAVMLKNKRYRRNIDFHVVKSQAESHQY